MKKILTGMLLAASVLAIATAQPASAASTGTGAAATGSQEASIVKEVHYVVFQNGKLVDIQTALTGSAVTSESIKNYPKIANYKYSVSEEMNGIMYHTYSPIATSGDTNSGTQTNPYHRNNNQTNGSNAN
ncbi:hypothetical protein MK484_04145 [Streptococcus mitis]|uniref:hypothetical protein n=1 Tax=Streptococcus mitis TaxID=28037 RepID=UPI0011567C26|nr:hypothetical protein [Streptococcus mitis]MCY7159832.1 hypothetical protein [Streptococcus mitis]